MNCDDNSGSSEINSSVDVAHISLAVPPSPGSSSGYNSDVDKKFGGRSQSVQQANVKFSDDTTNDKTDSLSTAVATKDRDSKTQRIDSRQRRSTSTLRLSAGMTRLSTTEANSLEFVPPDQGTPAAEALAGFIS
jgi:hypothetical protein